MDESLKEIARRFRERIEAFERRLDTLEKEVRRMSLSLTALQNAVAAQSTLITQVQAQVASSAPGIAQSDIDGVTATVTSNNAALQSLVPTTPVPASGS
jgi:uncharacterized coiled-coil protein SlyX